MESIGRYRVVRRLGAGGQGRVFLVQDPLDAEGRHIALKQLGPAHTDDVAAALLREFSTLAAIMLPGIPPVLDFGTAPLDEGGKEHAAFFTRAYVEGRDLDSIFRDWDIKERIAIILEVLETVGPLHRIGVVHGDLKPSNILITDAGRPQIIDFGLARLVTEAPNLGGSGTPAFMAPEVMHGGSPTSRSDVYALGGILFEAIHGAMEFDARERGGDANQPVSPPLHEVLTRALQVRPEDRYPDAAEMSIALRAALGNADPPGTRAPFVPPRPRGFDALISDVEAQATSPRARGTGSLPVTIIHGEGGAGKSTVLREVKWRLQARGLLVLELPTVASGTAAAYEYLLAQLPRAAPTVHADAAPRLEMLLSRLLTASEDRLVVVIADDIHRAPPDVIALLSRLPFVSDRLRVIATTRSITDVELDADQVFHMQALNRDVVKTLAQQALGPIDAAVVDALHDVSRGRPSTLIFALRSLSWRHAPSVHDVRALPLDNVGRAEATRRIGQIHDGGRAILDLLSLTTAAIPTYALQQLVPDADAHIADLVFRRVVREHEGGCQIEDNALREVAREGLDRARSQFLAGRLRNALDSPPPLLTAQLAQLLGTQARDEMAFLEASDQAARAGATRQAVELLEAVKDPRAAIRRAELYHELSEYDAAQKAAQSLCDDEDTAALGRALMARSLIAAGAYTAAEAELAEIPTDAEERVRGLAARERGRMLMRRGEYEPAIRACEEALSLLAPDSPERVEALTTRGMSLTYTGALNAAWESYTDALHIANDRGRARDSANVIAYMGIAKQRAGDLDAAKDHYLDCLERARALGDAGSVATFSLNLGGVQLTQLQYGDAEEHIRVGLRVSRRIGKRATSALSQANLAYLCAQTGRYEEAIQLASEARRQALADGFAVTAAMACQVLGEVAARRHDLEEALEHWSCAINEYRELVQEREVLDVALDIISATLDAKRLEDSVERMADVEDAVIDTPDPSLSLRYRLLRARLLLLQNAYSEAQSALQNLLPHVQGSRYTELRWEALHNLAAATAGLGQERDARLLQMQAVEVLEGQAAGLAVDVRDAFWQDARRQAVRDAVAERRGTRHLTQASQNTASPNPGLRALPQAMHLLEITKRLASEHDIDRLLTVITDAAVEISGAERGFVLTINAQGQLEPYLVRHGGLTPDDPHVAFSRSIADAVLIDESPLVTVDASEDHRLSEFVSVHQMMLKSVVALPIRGRSGMLGVLYLEHRMRRGRFAEVELELLVAFADQSAIALENARLLTEAERRHEELQRAHQELSEAKSEVDRVLNARTEELQDLQREVASRRETSAGPGAQYGIIGRSVGIRNVLEMVRRVRRANVPVVIHGESGTGKELVARAIHFSGDRGNQTFMALNCAAIPEQLLESTLFGHVKGAFTGADRNHAGILEQASGGTLFLDEVGDMPMKMQIDLLRVLQDGRVRRIGGEVEVEVDVRIVSASNKSLPRLVESGEFREDLFYRLHVVEIALPPLRDRREDIPLLVDHFLKKHAAASESAPRRLSREALEHLCLHPLPGNVRQLEHILLNATIMSQDVVLSVTDLPAIDGAPVVGALQPVPLSTTTPSQPQPASNLQDHKEREREAILHALEAHDWNRAQAARALGIPRRTFYRRLTEHNIL